MTTVCPTCGQKERKPRSPQDHRRFFCAISAAYTHWIDGQRDFTPVSPEHLRAFLLCKAGYHKVDLVDIPDDLLDGLPEGIQITVLNILKHVVHKSIDVAKDDKDFVFERPHGSGIAIFRPRSLNFETLDQRAFAPIREAVEEIIEVELGMTVDKLLEEHERAA